MKKYERIIVRPKISKATRKVVKAIHNLKEFKPVPAGHYIDKGWSRFDYNINGKKGELITICIMTISPD